MSEWMTGARVWRVARATALMLTITQLFYLGRSEAQREGDSEASGGRYIIGPGDTLDVIVWRNPDLSREVPVRPDGWISLPLVNDVEASGKTPMELRQTIADRLKEFVSDPIVSIIVTQIRSLKVTFLGKVTGQVQFQGKATILEVLALSGGFDDFSKPDDIFVVRGDGAEQQRLKVKYSDLLDGKQENIRVQDGDIIIVE